MLVFTAEEVWGTRFPDAGSVHLLEWPDFIEQDRDFFAKPGNILNRWREFRSFRTRVTEAIEPLRRERILGSSLEAEVELSAALPGIEQLPVSSFEELLIVSSARLKSAAGDQIKITRTTQHKCGRCWRHLPDVTSDGALCSRCDHVVGAMEAAS